MIHISLNRYYLAYSNHQRDKQVKHNCFVWSFPNSICWVLLIYFFYRWFTYTNGDFHGYVSLPEAVYIYILYYMIVLFLFLFSHYRHHHHHQHHHHHLTIFHNHNLIPTSQVGHFLTAPWQESRISNLVRWNAAVMVSDGNRRAPGAWKPKHWGYHGIWDMMVSYGRIWDVSLSIPIITIYIYNYIYIYM